MKALVLAAALFAGSHAFAETLTVKFVPCPVNPNYTCATVRGYNDGAAMGVTATDQTVIAEINRQVNFGLWVNVNGRVSSTTMRNQEYYQLEVYSFSTPGFDSRPRGFQSR